MFKTAALLDNIRDAEPVVIQGINGGDITCDKVGDFLGQVVYYNDMAVANILSWYKLSKELMLDWDAEQNVFMASTPDGDTLTFSCVEGGLYACDMTDYTQAGRTLYTKTAMALKTVEGNKQDYSKREVNAAEQARKLSRQLGYASDAELARVIQSGTILNNAVTTADVTRANKIFGKDPAELKGKTTKRPAMQSGGTEKVEVTVREEQALYMDIMFVDGIPFLVSAAQPLGLIQVTDLSGRRHASVLHSAFIEHMDNLTNKAYKVIAVYADGEGGIDAIKDYIKKVAQYNPAGPEQHVPVIERTIRTIKERVRAILCGLPYTLPSSPPTVFVKFFDIPLHVLCLASEDNRDLAIIIILFISSLVCPLPCSFHSALQFWKDVCPKLLCILWLERSRNVQQFHWWCRGPN